jgi:hypothetical protein
MTLNHRISVQQGWSSMRLWKWHLHERTLHWLRISAIEHKETASKFHLDY